ncbi:hypothetical protein [Parasedimentitalea maritima]|nr:hypothetical protein [Zongyanglinia marina]
MKNSIQILGHSAPAPRMTKAAAVLLATALSVPVFLALSVLDFLVF